ncbi:DNA polymerase III subunit gamma/tau [Paenibacillus farraposensis]|uniref:DNA polymerase III subunit gamma/tau n=1 Tax=Paenibacillus farraposensis TaxID=2807095 RepID=A0ABW4D9N3_9BACL|nr:DNA polymerase III subunit gamma/tau [Paenibacillus farraposensis]MCC3381829.1 DNA polymerase III subunit gamma/tau [Paenibacillus farraposensis]
MNRRELTFPSQNVLPESDEAAEDAKKILTKEEAQIKEKAFFEEDEQVRLRDGKTYYLPPLGLKDARKLIQKLNAIDSGMIIANLIPDDPEGADRYHDLIDVLMMGFKPYYNWMTPEYLEEYVDLETAKQIIDAMIGLNGIKKSM